VTLLWASLFQHLRFWFWILELLEVIDCLSFYALLCILQKGWTRLAAASDKVYQLLAHGRWFSPGTPASSTPKTGRHDIAEILLKVIIFST
jgi:hypothetical protein